MRIFANKNIWKKIVLIFTIIFTIFLITPEHVEAGFGGEMMEPICDFIVGIGDGILSILHESVIKQDLTLIRINLTNDWWGVVRIVVTVVILAVALAAAAAITGGGAILITHVLGTLTAAGGAATVAASAIIANVVPIGIAGAYFATKAYNWSSFSKEVVFPLYSVTPRAIFSNEIPLFDVNFFKPNGSSVPYKNYIMAEVFSDAIGYTDTAAETQAAQAGLQRITTDIDEKLLNTIEMNFDSLLEISTLNGNGISTYNEYTFEDSEKKLKGTMTTEQTDATADMYIIRVSFTKDGVSGNVEGYAQRLYNGNKATENSAGGSNINDRLVKATGMDLDTFKANSSPGTNNSNVIGRYLYKNGNTRYILEYESIPENVGQVKYTLLANNISDGEVFGFSYLMHDIISKWYYIFRLIAIVGMMSVLVYIGIRILISSTSPQKAKYKQLLGDWLVGMVLLFTMHYIMTFSNNAIEQITGVFTSINPGGHVVTPEYKEEYMKSAFEEYGIDLVEYTETGEGQVTNLDEEGLKAGTAYVFQDAQGVKWVEWHTDLMGHIRFETQCHKNDSETYIGYTLMFFVMVLYTVSFVWTYIKRVIYMAFLTLIAPLVALTYPIDKANDGQAQGFNYWFKEYMFNLLLQPMHLLIYTILVSMAIKLAQENWVYSLVVLGFMVTAEKIVRQMFNFSKASTPGVFAGPAGAALTITAMRKLFGHGPRSGAPGKESQNGNGKDSEDEITSSGNKTKIRDGLNEFIENGGIEQEKNKGIESADNDESEYFESIVPSMEELAMMDNEMMQKNNSAERVYNDEEYENILRESGWSEEEIDKEFGRNNQKQFSPQSQSKKRRRNEEKIRS